MIIKELVEKYDPQNQFEVMCNAYAQVEYVQNNEYPAFDINVDNISNIILTGLGGSAIGGEVLQNLLNDELTIPFAVNRNYNLPGYAANNTLLIASSYSGNTEETLSAVNEGLDKGCIIVCVTTGGKLEELAIKNNLPVIKLKKGYQPRYALWINMFSVLKVFSLLKLISNQDDFIKEAKNVLKNQADDFSKEENNTLKLASELAEYIPVIYSVSDITSAAGGRLKAQFNENSKMHAFHNVLPEMNHNEIVGWETQNNAELKAMVIFIHDREYNSRIQKRISVLSEIIKRKEVKIFGIESHLDNYKLRIVELINYGDWVSYYAALLRKHDPSEIKNINYLKSELEKFT